jgi:hypothetical protein
LKNIDNRGSKLIDSESTGAAPGIAAYVPSQAKQPHSMFQNPQIHTKKVTKIATLY